MTTRTLLIALLCPVAFCASHSDGQVPPEQQAVLTIDARGTRRPAGLDFQFFNLNCALSGPVQYHRIADEIGPRVDKGVVLTRFGTVYVSLEHLDPRGRRARDARLTPFGAYSLRVPTEPEYRVTLQEFESDLSLMRWLLSLTESDVSKLEGPRRAIAKLRSTSGDFIHGTWLVVEGKSATAVLACRGWWWGEGGDRGFRHLWGWLFDEHGMAQMRILISTGSPCVPTQFNTFLSEMIGNARFSDAPVGGRMEKFELKGFLGDMNESDVYDSWVENWLADDRFRSLDRGPEETTIEDDAQPPAGMVLRHGGLVWPLLQTQSLGQPSVDPNFNEMSTTLVMDEKTYRVTVAPRGDTRPASLLAFREASAQTVANRLERLIDPAKSDLANALRFWRLTPKEVAAAGKERQTLATAFVLFRVDARTPDYIFYGNKTTVAAFVNRETNPEELRRHGFRPSLRCVVFDASGRERAVVRFAGEGVSEAGLIDLAKQLAANAEWAD
jgi:hypothetical protein